MRGLLWRLERKLETGTKTLWDEAIVAAVRRPLSLLIWVIGIAFAAEIPREATQAFIFEAVNPIRKLGVIAAFTWFLILLVRNGEKAYLTTEREGEKTIDRPTVDAIGKLLKISVAITGVLRRWRQWGSAFPACWLSEESGALRWDSPRRICWPTSLAA